jgi:hypothetical protein
VEILRAAMGDPLAYIPDLTLHHNMFGFPGWHEDSGSEQTTGSAYLQSSSYRFAKCGVYLQDNTEEWGGGIMVVPGAHRYPIRSPFPVLNRKIKTFTNRVMRTLNAVTVDVRAGDMVFFDSRLPHASTFPSRIPEPTREGTYHYPTEIPDEHAKLILYWDACNEDMARDFMENSVRRARKEEAPDAGVVSGVFYSDYLRRYFPDDYPDDFVSAATDSRVRIASLSKSDCSSMERNYQELNGRAIL